MEKLASRKLRMTGKKTMEIAEKLYTKGLISYPRTETNIFPSEINLVPLIQNQVSDHRWGQFAQRVLNDGPQPRNGKNTDKAHPPIHPTRCADGQLTVNMNMLEFNVSALFRNVVGRRT
jgi:DNA topoisomerase-3